MTAKPDTAQGTVWVFLLFVLLGAAGYYVGKDLGNHWLAVGALGLILIIAIKSSEIFTSPAGRAGGLAGGAAIAIGLMAALAFGVSDLWGPGALKDFGVGLTGFTGGWFAAHFLKRRRRA